MNATGRLLLPLVAAGFIACCAAVFALPAGAAEHQSGVQDKQQSDIKGVKVERKEDNVLKPQHVFTPEVQSKGKGLKPEVARELLGEGWRYFNAGNYPEARESFSLAAGTADTAVRHEATIGMALTAGKLGRYEEGVALLERLRREEDAPAETFPRLLELLLAAGRLDRFDTLRAELSGQIAPGVARQLDQLREKATAGGGLGEAWEALNMGNVEQAEAAFAAAKVQDAPDAQNEARLGLAYTLIKSDRRSEALPLLQELYDSGYKPDEVLPALVDTLMALGKTQQAKSYFPKLPDKERAKRQKSLQGDSFMREYRQAGKSPARLARFVYRHRATLNRCRQTGIFLTALSRITAAGMGDQAVPYLKQLLNCSRGNWNLRLNVIRELSRALPPEEALQLLLAEQTASKAPTSYKQEMDALTDVATGQLLEALDPDSAAYLQELRALQRLRPGHEPLQRSLGWACLDRGDYACAEEQFSPLVRKNLSDNNAFLGLTLALQGLGQEDKALELLEARNPPPGSALAEQLAGLYAKKGAEAYEAQEYAQARDYLQKSASLQGETPDILQLMAWSDYQLENYAAARERFMRAYEDTPSVDNAKAVLMVLDKQRDKDAAMAFEQQLIQESGDQALKELGQKHFATVTYPFRDRSVSGKDPAWLESNVYVRSKEGDPGFSRMQELGMPLAYHQPIGEDGELSVKVTTKALNADKPLDDKPYAGKYYRNVDNPDTQQRDMEHTLWVWVPEVTYSVKKPLHMTFGLGATPIHGTIDPMPTARVELATDTWDIEVFQRSVTDSIQSYVGQKDPYSASVWGRVLESGGAGSFTVNFAAPWWFSVEGGASYYWGHNVLDNYSVTGGASIGRTDTIGQADLSYGLFGTIEHFGNNQDFYTFGHGGYFSPEIFVVSGPFLRYQTNHGLDYWVDARLSAGLQYYKTADADHYHRTGANSSSLSDPAARDLNAKYKGDETFGPAGTLKVQGLKLLSDYIAVGSGASINTTGEHMEWQALLGLRFFFEPQETLNNTEDLFWATGSDQ